MRIIRVLALLTTAVAPLAAGAAAAQATPTTATHEPFAPPQQILPAGQELARTLLASVNGLHSGTGS